MAVRDRRGARPGRAPVGRAGFVLLACALYLAAAAVATWPAVRHADDRFLARGAPGHGEAAPGDHLQLGYYLWLPGHQLERGVAPWRDPYSFQPESEERLNAQGSLLGLAYWPLERAFGPVGAWNLFVLLGYVAAGGLTCVWLRELGLGRGAALAGGLTFALAPYRVAQSTGHLLGPISVFLPLGLFALERARTGGRAWFVLGGAALCAIPLSGQLHLALGAIPLFLTYGWVRGRGRRARLGGAAGAGVAAAAGVAVWAATVPGTVASGGRSLETVGRYSADWGDLVSRDVGAQLERFVFLGWATPLAAAVGLALLLRERRLGLAALLGAAAVVPVLLALGTNLPTYQLLWNALPPFRFPRVPERLMPIACLAIAALVAFAVARARWRLAPLLVLAVLVVDLKVDVYEATAADDANQAYVVLRRLPPGSLLELPVIRPQRHYGSTYLYYAMQAPRERPGGYSTVAPRGADRLARDLVPLNCGRWQGAEPTLEKLGVRYVAFHEGVYAADPATPDCRRLARRGLLAHGFRQVAKDGPVTLYEETGHREQPPP